MTLKSEHTKTQNCPPEISVVVPAYNNEKYLTETVKSLIDQSFSNWELIIVDDGSTKDNTRELSCKLAEFDSRITATTQANGGVSHARNTGYSLCNAQAKYILFLDADDVLMPSALKQMYDKLEADTTLSAVSCNDFVIDGQGNIGSIGPDSDLRHKRVIARCGLGITELPPQENDTRTSLLTWNGIRTPGCVLIRRAAYDALPVKFRVEFTLCEEWVVWVNLCKFGPIGRIDDKLLKYRRHSENASNDVRKMLDEVRAFRRLVLASMDYTEEEKYACRAGFRYVERQGLIDKLAMIKDYLRQRKLYQALRQVKYLAAHTYRYIVGTPRLC